MRAGTLALAVLLLLLAAPRPAAAQSDFSITGVIVSIQGDQDTFLIRESGGARATWIVRMTRNTEGWRDDHIRARLRVGVIVVVHGWFAGGNQIMARAIRLGGDRDDGWDGDRAGREIEIEGVIVDVDRRGRGVLEVQTRSFSRWPMIWTVRLTARTRVELPRGRDFEIGDQRDIFCIFREGDYVEVEGRLLGDRWDRRILAEEITLRSRRRFGGPGGPAPVDGTWRTVILHPEQGAVVDAREFTVIGHTAPGALVRVDVVARYGIFQQPVASGTVDAGRDGRFAFTVRTDRRFSGGVYTITVSSTFRGVTAAPVSVTVRQD